MNKVGHTLIEGMIVCGYTIGASHGIIYLRGEYRWLKDKMKAKFRIPQSGSLGQKLWWHQRFSFRHPIQMGSRLLCLW